ncbi:histidine kinase [[Eubacterium] cellulosolvens]
MSAEKEERIKELESLITELKSQLPAHSVKPQMLMRIEELEEELERLKSRKK